jgi:hypothetical protein
MSANYPPPRPRGNLATVVAWLMLAGGSLSALLVVFAIVIRRAEQIHPLALGWDAALIGGGLVAVVAAIGILRRRSWALTLAVVALAVGAIAFFAATGYLVRNPPGPPNTDGAGYDILGAATWGLILLAFAVSLALPSTRRELRAAPPAWYRDPSGQSTWRYWTGEAWSTNVA